MTIHKRFGSIIFFIFIILNLFSGCIENTEKTQCVILNGEQEFTSLRDAVAASTNGDELILCKGSYYGGVYINSSLTIKGVDTQKVTLYASKDRNMILLINAKDCQIESLTLTIENKSDFSRFIKGIEVKEDNCSISNVVIHNCTYGIYCKEQSEKNSIRNNLLANNQNGIELFDSNYNTIKENIIKNNSQFGILLFERAISNEIKDNSFLGNNEGIRLKGDDVQNNRITSNFFENNQEAIHECCGARNNLISNNEIE